MLWVQTHFKQKQKEQFLQLYTLKTELSKQPAIPRSFSTVLLIWKVSKHMTVSAVFQGHKGNHKYKSLPPPITNPPPSKSSLAVLPDLCNMKALIQFSPRIMVQNYYIWYHIYSCNIQRQLYTCRYLFGCGLTSVLNTLKNFIYFIERFSASLKKLP